MLLVDLPLASHGSPLDQVVEHYSVSIIQIVHHLHDFRFLRLIKEGVRALKWEVLSQHKFKSDYGSAFFYVRNNTEQVAFFVKLLDSWRNDSTL